MEWAYFRPDPSRWTVPLIKLPWPKSVPILPCAVRTAVSGALSTRNWWSHSTAAAQHCTASRSCSCTATRKWLHFSALGWVLALFLQFLRISLRKDDQAKWKKCFFFSFHSGIRRIINNGWTHCKLIDRKHWKQTDGNSKMWKICRNCLKNVCLKLDLIPFW